MKRLLLNFIFLFTSIHYLHAGDGRGAVITLEQQIIHAENRLLSIEKNLKEIDSLLKDYEGFPKEFKSRFKSILEKGAQCIVWEKKYYYAEKKYGENDISTQLYATEIVACNNMRKFRLDTMGRLKKDFLELTNLVDQLERAKNIKVSQATSLRNDIKELMKDKIYLENQGQ